MMELSVAERLVLLSTLPLEGDLTTLRIVRILKEDLSFTEEEHAALDIHTTDDGRMEWDSAAEEAKEISFGPKAHVLVSDTLEELDKTGKLTVDHLTLCDKFMEVAD